MPLHPCATTTPPTTITTTATTTPTTTTTAATTTATATPTPTPDAGDVDNAHHLLERVLGEDANARSLALWERYTQLELQAGDLKGALQV